ncbi:Homocysteine/selenocysteine methylase (S -methylmethionine-dependent) [Enterobacter asburiae]|uniref:Homocysteine/selenocysteine methylase (S -methylmethionine-dependent) n=1 Tax=Enterobacter asburiae TaxID=61645 RepID=A0A376F3L0_ENTAS|nr:Homocysteine/selenocysteine methylase (S -methylmethionine-dependent) [Enterobacter asburiae]
MSQNNPLTAILEKQPFVVLDGAMATELEARAAVTWQTASGLPKY